MHPWRWIDSPAGPGETNLALDDAILEEVREGRSPPTLRLYAWDPPALTVGRAQDAARDVDLEACAARGIAVLRRSTGGRAVLHDRELTYAVVVPPGLAPFGGTLEEAYRAVAAALVAALRLLGVADAAAAAGAGRGGGRRASPAGCFASVARHEIVGAGRKIVGSAQRRSGGAFLQHGSLLLEGHGARIAPLLRAGGDGGAMAGLEDLCGPRTRAQIAAAFVRAAGTAWRAAFSAGEPTAAERRTAALLERSRYRSPAWNAGTPSRVRP